VPLVGEFYPIKIKSLQSLSGDRELLGELVQRTGARRTARSVGEVRARTLPVRVDGAERVSFYDHLRACFQMFVLKSRYFRT